MFPRSGFKIARVLGIDIVVNPTWLLIYALVGISIGEFFRTPWPGVTQFGGRSFPGGPWPWIAGFVTAAVFFACLLAHELSHSFIAKRNGIEINRITLFVFGGVAEMSEDVTTPGVEFRMAAAGPLVTFLLAGFFIGLYELAYALGASPVFLAPLFNLGVLNLFVGLFNILPGFPLDGGRILRAAIWKATGDLRKATRAASIGGQIVAALIVGLGAYFLIVGNALSGVWLLFIGAFVFQLSRAGYQQTILRLAAAETTVGDLMYTNVPLIEASTSLTYLKDYYFSAYDLPVFPVTSNGGLTGVVSMEDLASINPSEWDLLSAGRIARPISEEPVASPGMPLERVLKTMLSGQEYMLILESGELKGILTRNQLMRYIEARVKR